MKFNKKIAVAVSGAVLLLAGQIALADSTTDIVDALVSKGVLTEEEGKLITKGHVSKQKTALEPKFKDGFVLESPNGDNLMKIGGRLHMDYRSFNQQGNDRTSSTNYLANAANESDTFDVRRARIELSGTFRKHFDYLLSTDLAGGNAGNPASGWLDQAYLNFKAIYDSKGNPLAQVRVGQFKSPMNLEKITSSNNVDFQERSVVNQLAPNEDRGIMIHGEPRPGLTFAGAIMTGEGAKSRNDVNARVDELEYVGRATVNFAQLIDNKEAIVHLGLSGSTTSFDRTAPNGWFSGTSSIRTEQRGVNIFSLPVGVGVNGIDNAIQKKRYGLEGVFAYGPFKIQGEYLENNFSGVQNATTNFDNSVKTSYIEALWLLTGEKYADFYKAGSFGAIKPKNEFSADNWTGGAWEIGVRYSNVDAHDFDSWLGTTAGASTFSNSTYYTMTTLAGQCAGTNTTTAAAGSCANTLGADTVTVGLKYVPNNNMRILLNYIDTSFDTPMYLGSRITDKERAITTRVQFMF